MWNKSACKDCQSVMGHFKGTMKVHGTHNVTYETLREKFYASVLSFEFKPENIIRIRIFFCNIYNI